ncbi:uncharacterized protein TRAVEDRAFT_53584 [Trametes versicolor FP-101664 SS1]|uniref:uncharacterized protein n=1 Tax=Trametes versicolor (strain FP-101664) TaxID=717944 RepID=UPI0004621832|nr:uncharacterized protein TRAVEDRAFT_53584 [Trametes versicolor FP-101664 SS1]EIW52156.1 hypothetical protein TRAVEDRAFT_53584 [Trametes versicolor FP-101664 SS1]
MPASRARLGPFVRPPRYESLAVFSTSINLPCGHTHTISLKPIQGPDHSEWTFEGHLGGSKCGEAEQWANALLPFFARLTQLVINEESRQHRAYEQRADFVIRTSCLLIHEVADMHSMTQQKLAEAEQQVKVVLVIFVLEALHTALWIILGYHYLIADPFISGSLEKGHWSARLAVVTTACTVTVTECFYIRRVYLIGPKYRWLVTPSVAFLVMADGFAIAASISAFRFTPSIADFQNISWLVSVGYGLAGVGDVVLACTLVFVLHRSRTGSKRTDSILDTLIIYSINTGVLTSIFSILSFIFALIIPGNLIYAGLSIVGTKLYANSVLAVLNSRREINNRFADDFTTFDLPEIPQDAGGTRHPERVISSLAWNAPRRSSYLSDCESVGQIDDITFASGRDGSCDEPVQGAAELKSSVGV